MSPKPKPDSPVATCAPQERQGSPCALFRKLRATATAAPAKQQLGALASAGELAAACCSSASERASERVWAPHLGGRIIARASRIEQPAELNRRQVCRQWFAANAGANLRQTRRAVSAQQRATTAAAAAASVLGANAEQASESKSAACYCTTARRLHNTAAQIGIVLFHFLAKNVSQQRN